MGPNVATPMRRRNKQRWRRRLTQRRQRSYLGAAFRKNSPVGEAAETTLDKEAEEVGRHWYGLVTAKGKLPSSTALPYMQPYSTVSLSALQFSSGLGCALLADKFHTRSCASPVKHPAKTIF